MPAALGKAGGAQLLAVQEQGVVLRDGCISPLAGRVGLEALVVPKAQAAACRADSNMRLSRLQEPGAVSTQQAVKCHVQKGMAK